MKKNVLNILLTLCFCHAMAQESGYVVIGSANGRGAIGVKEGYFSIQGSLEVQQGILDGEGIIELKEDLMNRSSGDITNGGFVSLALIGPVPQTIRPAGNPIRFRKMIIRNAVDSVYVKGGKLHVFDSLVLEDGHLLLDAGKLVIDSEMLPTGNMTGKIIKEREGNRIIPLQGDSILFIHALTNSELTDLDPGNLGITLTADTPLDSVLRLHASSTLDNSSISRSYQLHHNASSSGAYEVAMRYVDKVESSFYPKRSLAFGGNEGQHVQLPEAASGILAESYTIEVRLKAIELKGQRSFLILKNQVFQIGISKDKHTPELVHTDENEQHFLEAASIDLQDGLSHLLTARYDAGLQTLSFFADGALVQQKTEVLPAKNQPDEPFLLGRGFHGSMSEVRFWKRALPDHAIRTKAEAFLQGAEPGLYAYYDFEGNENVLEDRASGLDGTILGDLQNNWVTDTIAVPNSMLTAWQKNQGSDTFVNRHGGYRTGEEDPRIATYGDGDVIGTWTASFCTPPVITLPDYSICQGATVLLEVAETNYRQYEWYIGDEMVKSGTDPFYRFAPESDSTVVSVKVRDEFNCDNEAFSEITFFAEPDLKLFQIIGSDTLALANRETSYCPGAASSLYGGAWASYAWSYSSFDFIPETEDLGVSAEVSADKAGFYILTVTNAEGCERTDTVSVFEHSRPLFELEDVRICEGDSVLLSTGLSDENFDFLWTLEEQTVATTSSFYAFAAGEYQLTVTNATGCINTDRMVILFFEPPRLELVSAPVTFCSGDEATLEVANPIPGYTYAWYDGSGHFLQNGNLLIVDEEGTYAVSAESPFNAGGCATTRQVKVSEVSRPVLDVPDTVAFCGETTLSVAEGFAQYTWVNSRNLFVASTTHALTTEIHGLFELKVFNAPGCSSAHTIRFIPDETIGCAYNDTVSVCPPPANFPVREEYIKCPGEIYSLTVGSAYQPVAWFDSDYNLMGQGNSQEFIEPGRYTVSAGTDACTVIRTFEINSYDPPVSNLSPFISTCDKALVLGGDLRALNPNAIITWGAENAGDVLTADTSGIYSVQIETPEGCVQTFDTEVVFRGTDLTDLPESITIDCEGIKLDAGDQGISYTWSDGSTDQSLFVDSSGVYTVEIISEFGCVDLQEVHVQLNPPADSVFFLAVTEAFVGDTIHFVGLPTSEPNWYRWNFGDGNSSDEKFPVHIYTDTGTYQVVLTGQFPNGCVAGHTSPINILPMSDGAIQSPIGRVIANNILSFMIKPNPTRGKFQALIELNKAESILLELISGTDYQVLDQRQPEPDTSFSEFFDLSLQASGTYILRLVTRDKTSVLKIIKV
ncbi:MAG: PKD domain-containing protein [Cytophagales bacterium]|nr:PKD domain-containing protein [Cytophagales bacterium]